MDIRNERRAQWLVLVLVALSVGGCVSTSKELADSAFKTIRENPADKAEPTGGCQLTMELLYKDDGDYAIRSARECIKRKDGQLGFDGTIELFFKPRILTPTDYKYCADESKPVGVSKDGVRKCTWNNSFRDKFPISFRFALTDAAKAGGEKGEGKTKLRDLLQLIQIFRNGELVYRWVPVNDNAGVIEIEGERLEGTGIPHRAPFDLRLYPADVDLAQEVIDREPKKRQSKLTRRFEVATQAAVSTALPKSDKQVRCFLAQLDVLREKVSALARLPAPTKLAADASGCRDAEESATLRATLGKTPDFAQAYSDLKSEAREGLEEAIAKLEEEATAALSSLGVATKVDFAKIKERLTEVVKQFEKDLAVTEAKLESAKKAVPADGELTVSALAVKVAEIEQSIDRIKDLLQQLDTIVAATMGTLDEGIELVGALKLDFEGLIADPKRSAAAVHQAVASDLSKEGDFFDPYGENPSATGDEAIIAMEYSDKLQAYFLTPWNGVPIRLSGDDLLEESGTFAIPIIDLVGWRYQFGRSRFTEMRWAVGSAIIDDAIEAPDSQTAGDSEIRWAGVLSFSAFNLRVGLGVVPSADNIAEDPRNLFRVFAGVSLYKLITGRDIEIEER